MLAYILINCIPSSEKSVISKIKKMPEVIEINGVMGQYDIFVKVSARIPRAIDTTIQKIRSIEGITTSYSMPVLYGLGGTIDQQE